MITAAQLQAVETQGIAAGASLGRLMQMFGTNLSGAEFAPGTVPGVLNTNYTFPTLAEVAYYVGKGMTVFRLPFLWERIQPVLGGPLDPAHIAWITSFAQAYPNVTFLLDVHNYGYYGGVLIGATGGPTQAQFCNLWSQLATAFLSSPNVACGLMNEPSAISASAWLADCNAAIAAIRATGNNGLITVPGLDYTGAWSWTNTSSNYLNMVPIVDPASNWAYEVHQYFDSDGSGRYATAAAPPAGWSSVGNQRLASITTWARSIPGTRLFLGEFGVANNTAMLKCLTDCAAWMQANADVWLGGTYWSGGPWWGTYIYSIEPTNLGQPTQADSAQMVTLEPYLP